MRAQPFKFNGSALGRTLGDVWRRNLPLALLAFGMLAMLVVAMLGLLFDQRIITGAPAWMKPAKFALSIAIYAATLIWLLQFLRDRPRLVKVISWLALGGFATEMALITLQVVRNTTSHFNVSTTFDATVWITMGSVIVAMWLLTLGVAVLLFRRTFGPPAIVWGVRMGLIASLLGMAVAFFMTRALRQTGGSSATIGGHAVGVADGGPGLPIVGWSTTGGDLRIAHFVGIHGLQVLPIVGWLLVSFAPVWLSIRGRANLTVVAGLAWVGLTALLTWQAKRGQPLIAPDGLTLAALGGVIGVTAILAALIVARDAPQSGKGACP